MSSPSSLLEPTHIRTFKFPILNSCSDFNPNYPNAHYLVSFYRDQTTYPFEKKPIYAICSKYLNESPSSRQIEVRIDEDQIFIPLPTLIKDAPPLSIRYFTTRAQTETIMSSTSRANFKFVEPQGQSLSIIFLNHIPQY